MRRTIESIQFIFIGIAMVPKHTTFMYIHMDGMI